MHIAASLILCVATFAGCAPSDRAAGSERTWGISDAPALVITESPGHEFNGVSSALRLADGRVLVANAGVPELALFDSTGRYVRPVGRKGQGPGEFQGPISVFRWRADSVAVYDPAAVRWTILDPALLLARTVAAPDSAIRQPTWLYQGAIISDGIVEAVPSWISEVLAEARRSDVGFNRLFHGRRDDLGALWIRDSLDGRRWAVHTDTGAAQATVSLPANLEPLQIGRNFVLGLVRDSLDVERLQLHSLQRLADVAVAPSTGVAALPRDSAVLGALPALLMAQEVYYAKHAKYAASADSLQLSAPFPYRLFVLGGDSRHWSAVAVRTETGATCGLSVGWPAPIGWLDGTPVCGR